MYIYEDYKSSWSDPFVLIHLKKITMVLANSGSGCLLAPGLAL